MTDETTNDKVREEAFKLVGKPIEELRALYLSSFGVATRSRNKDELAMKIATFIVTGKKGEENTVQKEPELNFAGDEGARVALKTAKLAWEETERLLEEKKTKLAEFTEIISKQRESINEVMKDETSTPLERISKVESFWQALTQAEAKKTEIRREYNERLKDSKQRVKSVFDNVRQLALFDDEGKPVKNG